MNSFMLVFTAFLIWSSWYFMSSLETPVSSKSGLLLFSIGLR